MTGILGSLSTEDFLECFWQKQPLFVKQAIANFDSPVTGHDLAAMACDEDIESRLVSGNNQQHNWVLEFGPFQEDRFAVLPAKDWVLLVQGVDLWLPEVGKLKEHFRFLPDWRIDDIMISYAKKGGGVGPHYDNYDVFLLQASGVREWQTGQHCDDHSELQQHSDLKLLKDFQQDESFILNAGDMLYLPPGKAHWGTAFSDDCITISIGFRAPSHGEIVAGFGSWLEHLLPQHDRYSDTDLAERDDPSEIDGGAVKRLQDIIHRYADDPALLATWLGQHMTEPKYQDLTGEFVSVSTTHDLQINPDARLAWYQVDSVTMILFCNGESLKMPATTIPAIKRLCKLRAFDLGEFSMEPDLLDQIIKWLNNHNAVEIDP